MPVIRVRAWRSLLCAAVPMAAGWAADCKQGPVEYDYGKCRDNVIKVHFAERGGFEPREQIVVIAVLCAYGAVLCSAVHGDVKF